MKANRTIVHYSLFAALISFMSTSADAAVRVSNYSNSRGDMVQSSNAVRNSVIVPATQNIITTPSTDMENNLPVRVADEDLAQEIASGATDTPVAFNQLEQCSMIYPNGEFAWDSPMLGLGAGGAETCVAVVELRGYQAGPNGSDLVLARANLAAGDSFKCNISSFPEATMMVQAVESFTFPADAAPTIDDVVNQMNQEQKQNAGIKIAAGALIGGIGGNMAGENDRGNDSLLGADKGKIQGSLIGALSGAALMAGNTYGGKVAGDVILSTGVNAAAGGVVGNMSGTGDDVLRIEDCKLPDGTNTTCLWGALVTTKPLDSSETAFYEINTGDTYVCDKGMKNCKTETLASIKLDAYPNLDIEYIQDQQFQEIVTDTTKQYYIAVEDGKNNMVQASISNPNADVNKGIFAKIASAGRIERQIPAMIKMADKAFGMTSEDWREWKSANKNYKDIYGRTTGGEAYVLPESAVVDIQNFKPMTEKATDGGLIDLGNKARLKSTLIGAGVGGALGGYAAYQGAQSDIQNRWVTASQEYEDSLSKVYCATGNRYLSKYNDTVYIPNMTVVSE